MNNINIKIHQSKISKKYVILKLLTTDKSTEDYWWVVFKKNVTFQSTFAHIHLLLFAQARVHATYTRQIRIYFCSKRVEPQLQKEHYTRRFPLATPILYKMSFILFETVFIYFIAHIQAQCNKVQFQFISTLIIILFLEQRSSW